MLYPELSFEIIGSAYDVFNELRWGHKEVVYQRAYAKSLVAKGIKFEKEKYAPVNFQGENVGKNFFDFLVDGKVIVELKVVSKFGYVHIDQVSSYLKSVNLNLAIIIYFLKDGVRFKRLVNDL